MILLLEKLESESSEDLRVYTEAQIRAIYADRFALVSKMLPFGVDGEWKTILRVGAQLPFIGKTFCSIESFALRIHASVLSLVEDGIMSRDAIVLYQRQRTVEEMTVPGSLDTIVLAFLFRRGKATRLAAEDVLSALPSSSRQNMPYRIGRDLDDGQ